MRLCKITNKMKLRGCKRGSLIFLVQYDIIFQFVEKVNRQIIQSRQLFVGISNKTSETIKKLLTFGFFRRNIFLGAGAREEFIEQSYQINKEGVNNVISHKLLSFYRFNAKLIF